MLRTRFPILAIAVAWLSLHAAAFAQTAPELVRQALKAELANRPQVRQQLLQSAISRDADYAPAHWQQGEIQQGEQWLSVDVAAERRANDPRWLTYQRMRAAATPNLASHLALARYCRKYNLPEYARWHWTYVFSAAPNNKEAIKALGLKKHKGHWLTERQIPLYDAYQQQQERWAAQTEAWREAIEGGEPGKRSQALAEIQAVREPAAIPFLESQLSELTPETSLAITAALGKIHDREADSSLLRHALFSNSLEVRRAAVQMLKKRPLHSYIPTLMGAIVSPVKMTYYVRTYGVRGLTWRYDLYREGPEADYALEKRIDFRQSARIQVWSRVHAEEDIPVFPIAPSFENKVRRSQHAINQSFLNRMKVMLPSVAREVERENERVRAWNQRLFNILRETTAKELVTPEQWWSWWRNYNELHHQKREITLARNENYENHELYLFQFSCFMPGVPVWTEAGLVPIERVRVGDRVLSQNPDTGELAYKFVLHTTVRPPSETLRLLVGDDEIVTTLGHPLWAVGEGWKMAKFLEQNQRLRSVRGAVNIDLVQPGPMTQAHNLVVADFNNYFVGNSGVLAHDNTIRKPTRAVVPGLLRKAAP